MVMIWNQLAEGDGDYCAILVIINSILQIILYSPMSLFFINVISGQNTLTLQYGKTAIAVCIYLGIPLLAGVITRFGVMSLIGRKRFENAFSPYFGPLALVGLLYTYVSIDRSYGYIGRELNHSIILIFAGQATRILDNIGDVFRVVVPMVVYFVIMWTGTFFLVWALSRRRGGARKYGYKMAVVQVRPRHIYFRSHADVSVIYRWIEQVRYPHLIEMSVRRKLTSSFELAIAVCVAIYGVDSDQALAATIGPLVEVPVLLALTYVSLLFKRKLKWEHPDDLDKPDATV
jgi:ACR3 family arsenite transporter